jgi:PIN domain
VLVTLQPGAEIKQVLQILDERRILLRDCKSYSGSLERWNGFTRWVFESVRTLRGRIHPGDIDQLVLTPDVRRLLAMHDQPQTDVLLSLLSLEFDARLGAFAQACFDLQQQIAWWQKWPGGLTVVDTSVFIHHPAKIRDIDFSSIVGARSEPVRVIVPLVVVDELDRLKSSGNSHTRWRAAHTLGVLDELIRIPRSVPVLRQAESFSVRDPEENRAIRRGEVTIEVLMDPPGHVRLADEDEEIIDRAVAVRGWAGRRVYLVTMDTGMTFRGRMLDLEVVKVRQELGEEPIPQDQRKPRQRPAAPSPQS